MRFPFIHAGCCRYGSRPTLAHNRALGRVRFPSCSANEGALTNCRDALGGPRVPLQLQRATQHLAAPLRAWAPLGHPTCPTGCGSASPRFPSPTPGAPATCWGHKLNDMGWEPRVQVAPPWDCRAHPVLHLPLTQFPHQYLREEPAPEREEFQGLASICISHKKIKKFKK